MVGELAVSKAGHDRGSTYLIVREEETCVYLADGSLKRYAAPKKKNKRHIQRIHSGLSAKEMESLAQNPADADTKIKRLIKLFERNRFMNREV